MSLFKTKLIFNAARSLSTGSVRAAVWNKEWKPGNYPVTEEERLAAAKKYGLLPEEYKPIPDDGAGAGDYPDIKPFSVESRDPFYPWDMPEYRRNYGEAVHEHHMIFTNDRVDINYVPKYSWASMFCMLVGTLGFFYGLTYISQDSCFFPYSKWPIPEPGKKHYTYE